MAAGDSVGRRIWKFIRNTVATIIGLLVLWGIVAYAIHLRHEMEVAKVTINLQHKGRCTEAEYPLEINISNDAKKIINETRFYISARTPGYSTDLVSTGYRTWDRIIKPGEKRGTCWGFPRLTSEGYGDKPLPGPDKGGLEWTVELHDVVFGD